MEVNLQDVGNEIVEDQQELPSIATEHVVDEDPELSAYRKKLAEAEREYIEAGMQLAEIREKIVNLKQSQKDAEELWTSLGIRLRNIRTQGEAQLDLFPNDPPVKYEPSLPEKKLPVRRGGARVEPHNLPPDRWEPPVTEATYWRHASIEELELDTIHGLGARKLAAFKEAVPTVGHLEDLRIEAAREFVHLHKKLPKGFGEATADELTERLLNWLSKNREAPPRKSPLPNVEPASELPQEEIDPDLFLYAIESTQSPMATPDSQEPKITKRYSQLKEAGFQLPDDNQDCRFGYFTHREGSGIDQCPHDEGERQDNWLMGYIASESGLELP